MGNTQVVARVLPIYLHTAARNGLIERMRYLIDELHVNIDEKDHEYKTTALHIAAGVGQVEAVKLLLEKGAYIHSRGEQLNETPLHMAAWEGQAHTAFLLLQKGADVHAVTASGATPLHLAASIGSAPVCQILLQFGARPSARDKEGKTPLQRATGAAYVLLLEVQHSIEQQLRKETEQSTLPEQAFMPLPSEKDSLDAGAIGGGGGGLVSKSSSFGNKGARALEDRLRQAEDMASMLQGRLQEVESLLVDSDREREYLASRVHALEEQLKALGVEPVAAFGGASSTSTSTTTTSSNGNGTAAYVPSASARVGGAAASPAVAPPSPSMAKFDHMPDSEFEPMPYEPASYGIVSRGRTANGTRAAAFHGAEVDEVGDFMAEMPGPPAAASAASATTTGKSRPKQWDLDDMPDPALM